MGPLYRALHVLVGASLRLFFRLEPAVDPHRALTVPGPVIYVGNHPNGLIDPALLFVLVQRPITFLAKEPLFRMPVLGGLLRALQALPVYRKRDGADPAKNDATLTAAVDALVEGRALTIFPEGKSHSEPQLAELKTGCARMALAAQGRGAQVRVVPIGLTYTAKNRFRSHVHCEVGAPLEMAVIAPGATDADREAVSKVTSAVADALEAVTLNVERWEDVPLIETAEALYQLRVDQAPSPERTRAFARGLKLVREEEPQLYAELREELDDFREQLQLVRLDPSALSVSYRPLTVARFVAKNLLWLLALPVFAVGMAAFVVPYWLPVLATKALKPELDVESTVKIITAIVVAPVWWVFLTVLAWVGVGGWGALIIFAVTPGLAFFTRAYLEGRSAAWRSARTFLKLQRRTGLQQELAREGLQLATRVEALAQRLAPRVA